MPSTISRFRSWGRRVSASRRSLKETSSYILLLCLALQAGTEVRNQPAAMPAARPPAVDPQAKEQLIKIARPKEGDDFFKLWQSVAELVDAINDISVSIVGPQGFCFSAITEGDIQLRFDSAMALTPNAVGQQSSNPTSGNTDNPGGPPSGDDDTTGHGNPGCTPGDYAAFGALCGSIVVLRQHGSYSQHGLFADSHLDVADVYDTRFSPHFVGTMQSNNFTSNTVGLVEAHYGIAFGFGAYDNIISCCAGDAPTCPAACPPAALGLHLTLYQEDFDNLSGWWKKPSAALPP